MFNPFVMSETIRGDISLATSELFCYSAANGRGSSCAHSLLKMLTGRNRVLSDSEIQGLLIQRNDAIVMEFV